MKSAIYEGRLTHSRTKPVRHAFEYDISMLYLDLDYLEKTFLNNFFWSYNRLNLGCFLRADYFGNSSINLKESIQSLIKNSLKFDHQGKIYLLTSPRYFGYCFNPVSFYYCFNRMNKLEVIVSHITNTPWNENHAYVHDCRHIKSKVKHFDLEKKFHVSPFMPMDIQYDWRFTEPKNDIVISMNNTHKKQLIFNASLRLKKRLLTTHSLNRLLFLFPPQTFKTILAIYWHALCLKLKQVPFFSHP